MKIVILLVLVLLGSLACSRSESASADHAYETGVHEGMQRGYNLGYADAVAGNAEKLNLNYLSGAWLAAAMGLAVATLVAVFVVLLVLIFVSGSSKQKVAKTIGALIAIYLWFRFIYPELAGLEKFSEWREYSLHIELGIVLLSFAVASLIRDLIEKELEVGALLICQFLIPVLLTGIYSLYVWGNIGAVMGTELFVLRIHGAVFVGSGAYFVKMLISK